ncbi:unnamed protein product [Gordionus sp. m RMFG-2023]|uniref:large ribosomal subunit protein mL46-like n=1 Tax=Gordionus sp. m RMFG-2023 TaxID=3053472 RepID=UPI0030E43BF3
MKSILQSTKIQNKWQIFSACCLQRPPIISKEKTELETRYQNLLYQIEYEHSVKSDFELKSVKEIKNKKDEKSKAKGDLLTPQELEDRYVEEFNMFKTNLRTNQKKNTIDSYMDSKLYLVTHQQLGQSTNLIFPTQLWEKGETLKETSEKALNCLIKNPKVQPLFLSYAPIGFYKYKYPKPVSEMTQHIGAKMFFFMAYLTPKYQKYFVHNDTNASYKWFNIDDMKNNMKPSYFKALRPFILCQ